MLKPVSNPPNRFSKETIEWLDVPPLALLEVFEEEARSVISKNDSPDVGFTYSINPYRGCFHACAYCYARPSHQYLDLGAGTDFERKLVVKVNAAEKLREAFMKPSWRGDMLVFSGNTDCYQPLELSYGLTRKCLEVCLEFKNPVSIITKGALISRDIDLLKELKREAGVFVWISLAFSEDQMSKKIEPNAPRPSTRLRTMKELNAEGVPFGVALAPVIPGLNDYQIANILEASRERGAVRAFMTLLRLPAEVRELFLSQLEAEYPSKYSKVLKYISDMKGGALNRSEFGKRMHGEGPRWEALEFLFDETCRRIGLNATDSTNSSSDPIRNTFHRPDKQLTLFR